MLARIDQADVNEVAGQHGLGLGGQELALRRADRVSESEEFALLSVGSLWVPETRPTSATGVYAWITPPSRSRRITLSSGSTGSGSGRRSAAWCSGRWVLKCVSYVASTLRRCRSLMISVRSRSSRRHPPIQHSTFALARGPGLV